MTAQFSGGQDIAMNLPKAQFEATVGFYRDVLGMDVTDGKRVGLSLPREVPREERLTVNGETKLAPRGR